MLFADGKHVRVKINMARPCARHGKSESHHLCAVESAHHLTADFLSHHEHAQRDKLSIGEVPNVFLQSYASPQLVESLTAADHDGIRAHDCFSCRLACCQSDSSSSIETLSGVVPFSSRRCSI